MCARVRGCVRVCTCVYVCAHACMSTQRACVRDYMSACGISTSPPAPRCAAI